MRTREEIAANADLFEKELTKIGDAFTNFLNLVHKEVPDPVEGAAFMRAGASITAKKLIAFLFAGMDGADRKKCIDEIYKEAVKVSKMAEKDMIEMIAADKH